MNFIAALQQAVTAVPFNGEPSDAELDAIEQEMPLIDAEIELLDAQIVTLDRPANEVDQQRIRRARNRVLAERCNLANRATQSPVGGAA
ncbi:DUF6284 family protein [Streptomyces sp. NPDC046203]|uniref:DUF6284 family protein n=1 Tax=Streptomyces sp. NPDC046203 TaxID=3154602 RepID=UPI00340EA024